MKYKYFIFIALLIFIFQACESPKFPSINILDIGSFNWREKEHCSIIYSDNNGTSIYTGKIKYRGGISGKYDKHSYALELNSETSLANLPSDDDWILNATYVDKTFMRHKISYDLFRAMNDNNIASRCAYINLKTNNNNDGLYILMEEINGGMVKLDKTDSLAMLFKGPAIFFAERLDYVQDSLNYYQQKFPKIAVSDKAYYLDQLRDFMFNSSDEDFLKNIDTWVDIDNIIDWHLMLLYTNNSDGVMKNFYFYKMDSNTPFRIAIWDYDHSFGRDGDNELNMMRVAVNWEKSILLKRLMSIPHSTYPSRLKSKWYEHRASKLFSIDNFNKQIDLNDKIINGAVKENAKIWPINAKWYYDANDYEKELNIMREFVVLRIDQLDKYFKNL